MVSYLTKNFGLGGLDLAEDVVQDTLCRALEMWPVHGLPDNPSAPGSCGWPATGRSIF